MGSMKIKNRSVLAAKIATGFGTAMASLFVVNELHSEEIDLTFLPDTIPFQSSTPQVVLIDELSLAFSQWNDFLGKTISANQLSSFAVVSSGALLSPATFSGESSIDFPAAKSSELFVGFRSAGNVGWFQIDLGGAGLPISYMAGRFATAGESLTVGGKEILRGDVNCDGVLDLLDVAPFVEQLTSGKFSDKADMNADGAVDLLDVGPFIDALSG